MRQLSNISSCQWLWGHLLPGVCARVCVRSVHECVCVVTNIVGQHTHTHTHPYTRTDTPRLCCNFFSFSLPCCCLPLPALVIIVFAFFSSFFLFLVNLLAARLPCCCCWLSSLVRNVIKFLLVQQHSTLFSSPYFYCSCCSSSFPFALFVLSLLLQFFGIWLAVLTALPASAPFTLLD